MPKVWITRVTKRGKRVWVARWLAPGATSTSQRTIGAVRKGDAERFAARLEEELRTAQKVVPWDLVKSRFQTEWLSELKSSGHGKWTTTMNQLEEFAKPESLFELDTDLVSRFAAHLRSLELATATIRSYLSELNRTLVWAEGIWPGYTKPKIRKPKSYRRRRGKGRPITKEEFERMLDKVPSIVGPLYAESWQHTLWGFWLSGLRLNDVCVLRWHDGPLAIVNIDSSRPKLYVAPGEDKSGREESLPIHHFGDLVEFLRRTPERERRAYVFSPQRSRGRVGYENLSRTLSEVGQAAGVVVAHKGDRVKCASAHDLRASFATRWAPKVSRELLRRWMRHRHYQTTDQYYVDIDLDTLDRPEVAEPAWEKEE